MSSTSMAYVDESATDDLRPYRVLSKAAVVSVLLALLSLLSFAFTALLCLPLIGFLSGLLAWRTIRKYPDEVSGTVPAILGMVFSGVVFAASVTLHSVAYATEVPPGYARISFANLQPSPSRPDMPIPPSAFQLNGKRVYVKGYLYPDGQQDNIKRFVLVPDMGTCCFGGQPKLTDMIEVTLQDPLRTEFARRKRKLGGVLKVDGSLKEVSGLGGVYYQLAADYLQ